MACPECFQDQGVKLLATKVAVAKPGACPNCGRNGHKKLRMSELEWVAHTFFVCGTIRLTDYGGAPAVQFNQHQTTSVEFPPWTKRDARLFERFLGIGFFLYGPRMWMVGEIEPLKSLQDSSSRSQVVDRIVSEYPVVTLGRDTLLYRIRKCPKRPDLENEYDSPPNGIEGNGRLDSKGFPVMYASSDLQICVHECRTTAEDETFVATLEPTRDLKLLDLTEVLNEKDLTEFESLDLAVHMLFLAPEHSYEISRAISLASHKVGHDGIIYPSYFSLLRTGAMPFKTSYGISHRQLPRMHAQEKAKIVPNIALFGRPIQDGLLVVRSINRLLINSVDYKLHFGPVTYR
jgi:hypothetical protein